MADQIKSRKYKCSKCPYDTKEKKNIELHIRKCKNAKIIVTRIKCNLCGDTFNNEVLRIFHEKKCKMKDLRRIINVLPVDKQNEVLIEKYTEQVEHIKNIEKELEALREKFNREEEINTQGITNELGLSCEEMNEYCLFTLQKLYNRLLIPSIERIENQQLS